MDETAKSPNHILIVDDDEAVARTLSQILSKFGYRCRTASSGEEGLASIRIFPFDLILTDLVMPGFDGMTFIRTVKSIDPTIPIIMMTGYGSIDTAVEAMRAGAIEFITKPVKNIELRLHVEKALASREVLVENRELKDQLEDYRMKKTPVGKSRAMQKIATQIEQIAPSDATVLVTGETGTGKELIAEAIHRSSQRSDRPMIKVNCGALPESLLESELFGHVKGAFTGAYKDHQGRFEAADGGTLFLDEISEMTPSAQVRLLRVLQEGEFDRVGSSTPVKVDVRVIAATNRDLRKRVENGLFRKDLLYRINVFNLTLPPLRDRQGDITLLTHYFIERYAKKNNKRVLGVGQNALTALENYSWPGNVRELENAIEHGVVMAQGDRILLEDLPGVSQQSQPSQNITIPLGSSALQAEGLVLRRTLEMTQGDKEATAKILGFSPRTLYRKIKEHHIPLHFGIDENA